MIVRIVFFLYLMGSGVVASGYIRRWDERGYTPGRAIAGIIAWPVLAPIGYYLHWTGK